MRTIGLIVSASLLGLVAVGAQAPTSAPNTSGATVGKPTPAPKASGATVGKPKPAPTRTAIPRTPDGHPDLQGNWSNATITPLERLKPNQPLVLTEEAAKEDEVNTQKGSEARETPSSPDRGAPPVGGENRKSPNAEPTYLERLWALGGGAVGGYNTFWIDPGDRVLRVDGQPRSSILIDPPNGRVPGLTPAAQALAAKAAAIRRTQGSEFDHPELRPLAERCITSFGNNAGPPMLPNYFYNNNYSIVQSKDTVMILTEMVHDARVIRIGGQHPPAGLRKWFGDSIGRWEGDTLVIETTNFYPANAYRGSWENLKVTERLGRKDATTLSYRFTVEDPTTFTAPFSGELEFRAMEPGAMVYEYACHEANYGLEGVLSGARAVEREAKKK